MLKDPPLGAGRFARGWDRCLHSSPALAPLSFSFLSLYGASSVPHRTEYLGVDQALTSRLSDCDLRSVKNRNVLESVLSSIRRSTVRVPALHESLASGVLRLVEVTRQDTEQRLFGRMTVEVWGKDWGASRELSGTGEKTGASVPGPGTHTCTRHKVVSPHGNLNQGIPKVE